jgi:hypothetical protein
MHTKLAGRLPLQDMIAAHIESARVKLAAAEGKESKKDEKDEKKVEKLVKYEKKEHGGKIPSEKEEEAEKTASFDAFDPDSIDKLASALEQVAEKLAGDSVELGGEKKQGGEVLPTQTPTGGKQAYTGAKAKTQIPQSSKEKATKDNPGAATAMETDETRKVGPSAAYPAKGVLKTAGQTVLERIQAKRDEAAGEAVLVPEKTAGAIDYVLEKIKAAEFHGGGETLDDKSAPIPSNAGRQMIASNKAPVGATKREAKAPRKAELAQVLKEPALTSSTDNTVNQNLRNASKGGVKIAAAKAYLRKIAEEGCTCGKDGTCRHCKLQKAVEAKKAS